MDDKQVEEQAEIAGHYIDRIERFRQLALYYGITAWDDVANATSSAEEDVALYLSGEDGHEIARWIAVTQGGEPLSVFLKCFGEREHAERYANSYILNDIFSEAPLAIVDIDSNEKPWGKVYKVTKITVEFES